VQANKNSTQHYNINLKTLPRGRAEHSHMARNAIIGSACILQELTTMTNRIKPLIEFINTNNFAK
jgi:hypothetical protein